MYPRRPAGGLEGYRAEGSVAFAHKQACRGVVPPPTSPNSWIERTVKDNQCVSFDGQATCVYLRPLGAPSQSRGAPF
jgi:hypothetical protein